jgi:hypothetical protein
MKRWTRWMRLFKTFVEYDTTAMTAETHRAVIFLNSTKQRG